MWAVIESTQRGLNNDSLELAVGGYVWFRSLFPEKVKGQYSGTPVATPETPTRSEPGLDYAQAFDSLRCFRELTWKLDSLLSVCEREN